jgi:hypothetical protein
MITSRVIRYRTKPKSAEDNVRLIQELFSELAEKEVPGIRYEAYRIDDGISFVHVATFDSENNPLDSSPAFAAFQSTLGLRLEEGPFPAVATLIGSHGVYSKIV